MPIQLSQIFITFPRLNELLLGHFFVKQWCLIFRLSDMRGKRRSLSRKTRNSDFCIFPSFLICWVIFTFSYFYIFMLSFCHVFIFFLYFHIAYFPLFWSAGWFSSSYFHTCRMSPRAFINFNFNPGDSFIGSPHLQPGNLPVHLSNSLLPSNPWISTSDILNIHLANFVKECFPANVWTSKVSGVRKPANWKSR